MLIEFSVGNFRSFRARQTFSMVAAPRLQRKGNTFLPEVRGERLPELLKVAAIYGPNASGKSNLIAAFNAVQVMADLKPSAETIQLPVRPFRFDPALLNEPSSFELHFIQEGQRYEFQLSVTRERIVGERLISYPLGKETLLYDRRHTSAGDAYEFGDALEGGRELRDAWKKLTGPQMLFIAQAVANSSEELTQLKSPFNWLSSGVMIVGQNMRGWAESAQNVANRVPRFANAISSFLQEVDVPVTGIRFDPLNESTEISPPAASLGEDALREASLARHKKTKTTLTHKTALGEAEFAFNEESDGTKNLIGFWLPWSFIDDEAYHHTRALLVDELDSSLHPMIVASLVARHLQNKRPSQLIFTTHDTHLMDTKLLRRDQFWLTERDINGATALRSIHEFKGREGEDLEKRYYEGRYRSLPFVRRG